MGPVHSQHCPGDLHCLNEGKSPREKQLSMLEALHRPFGRPPATDPAPASGSVKRVIGAAPARSSSSLCRVLAASTVAMQRSCSPGGSCLCARPLRGRTWWAAPGERPPESISPRSWLCLAWASPPFVGCFLPLSRRLCSGSVGPLEGRTWRTWGFPWSNLENQSRVVQDKAHQACSLCCSLSGSGPVLHL